MAKKKLKSKIISKAPESNADDTNIKSNKKMPFSGILMDITIVTQIADTVGTVERQIGRDNGINIIL